MNLAGSTAMNIYSMALLAVIYYHSRRHSERRSMQHRLYMAVVQVTFAMLVFDTMGRFDGRPGTIYPVLNQIGNFMVFLLAPVAPSLWLAYVHHQVFRDERQTQKLLQPLLAINAANAVMTVLTLQTGWYYHIDEGNVYHRGPLFLVCMSVTAVLIVTAIALIVDNRKLVDRKHYLPLLFFPVPPLACIIVQMGSAGSSLIQNSVVLSLLVVFLSIQGDTLFTDYLTGVSNRKRLESEIEKKIKASTEKRTFSAILLDLDNFKSINDTFGHDVGDRALQISAQLLKSCLRADDFVGRFGGDEFCIVLSTSGRADLESIVGRIYGRLEKYSEISDEPYKLDFSMGYAVYDHSSRATVEEFLKQLDILMYQDKKRSAEARG